MPSPRSASRLAPALLAAILLLAALPAWAQELVLEVLDVGQGDAVLLTSPAGKTVLVDGGPPEAGPKVASELRKRGIAALDLVVISHPHLDHVGGLLEAVRAAPPKLVLDPAIDHPLPTYDKLLDELGKRSIPVRIATPGRTIDLGGGAVATVLAPPQPHLTGTRSDVNSNSIVLRVEYGKTSLLLTGDLEPDGERALLASGAALEADVLKVAHHGSKHSSTARFLSAVRPKVAVISCGKGNDYGHPTKDALGRLRAAGADVLRTDVDGTVKIVTDGAKLAVFAERDGAAVASAEPAAAADVVEASAKRGAGGGLAPASRPFVGSKRSKTFHEQGCPGAAKLSAKHVDGWYTREEAEEAGRKPAADCLGEGGRKRRRSSR